MKRSGFVLDRRVDLGEFEAMELQMLQMQRGQKAKIADLTPATSLEVSVRVGMTGGGSLDVSCFGLDGQGQLSDDRYFVFYNQKSSPCGSLAVVSNSAGDATFRVELARLPSSVRRLVFTATLDGAGSLASLGPSHLIVQASGQVLAQFSFSGADFATERAVMVAELYFKDVWRLAAVGQGFAGGLSALLAHFGGKEVSSPPPPPTPAAVPTSAKAPPALRLTKVTLDKKGASQTVSLVKGSQPQPIHINLNWDNPNAQRKGVFGLFGGGDAPDLDLGCMFEMVDGSKGVIQPLGGHFGSRTQSPFIFLDKDDRSGASADGENLYVNRPDLIKRVMVFSLIYEGAASYVTVNGRLNIKDHQGNEVLVPLNNPDSARTFCAICVIERRDSNIVIRKEELYFQGHDQADAHFGFGFRWVAGKK